MVIKIKYKNNKKVFLKKILGRFIIFEKYKKQKIREIGHIEE